MFEVKLPKAICLMLVLSKYLKKKKYWNTNDVITIAHNIQSGLIRLRKDKKPYEYKYFDDTDYGGLRGNISTASTLLGLIKKNNAITAYYSIGRSERLINAYNNGDIILDKTDFIARTDKLDLKILLENEARYFSIREGQAHIAAFLRKNPTFPLKRDDINFKNICVLKSDSNQFFLRVLFNTFIQPTIIEYNVLSYLEGPKIRKQNIHALFVVPSKDNNWEKFYVIDSKELLVNTPLFIYYDTVNNVFYDENKHFYSFEELTSSLAHISDENGNYSERMAYDSITALESHVGKRIGVTASRSETEESVFIKNFLDNSLGNLLFIKGKEVREYKIHRSGVDVTLEYADGTSQPLELEHRWSNYISHGHQNSFNWNGAWIYANEEFDFSVIKRIFGPYKGLYIPTVFLSSNPITKAKEAYEVDWNADTYSKLSITFHH